MVALFTIAYTWKQPKCPSRDVQEHVVYIMEYYTAVKQNKIMLFAATWMQLEILILSEVRKRQICIWNLKYGRNEPMYKTNPPTWRKDLQLPRQNMGGLGIWSQQIQTITFRIDKL